MHHLNHRQLEGDLRLVGIMKKKYKNCQVLSNRKSHLNTQVYVSEQALHSIESKAEGEKIKIRTPSAEETKSNEPAFHRAQLVCP